MTKQDPYIDALREVLVNMLMHADYFSPIKSRIRIFSDKIEFFNAGSYPKPLEFFLKNDVSMPRNPILARLFRAVRLAENAGYGFDKMVEGWKEYSTIPIKFETTLDTTTTTFYLPYKEDKAQVEAQVQLNETEKKVLFCLREDALSSKELVEKLHLRSLSGSLKNAIKHLINLNLILYTIPDSPNNPKQKYKLKKR